MGHENEETYWKLYKQKSEECDEKETTIDRCLMAIGILIILVFLFGTAFALCIYKLYHPELY